MRLNPKTEKPCVVAVRGMNGAAFRSVLVYRDGSVEVDFRDNSGIVVDQSGCCFASSSPSGVLTKKITSFATSAHRRQLHTAFYWRNRSIEPVLQSRRRLIDDWRQGTVALLQSRAWLTHARWSLRDETLLAHQPDGAILVSSADGLTQLCLAPHRRTFAVDPLA